MEMTTNCNKSLLFRKYVTPRADDFFLCVLDFDTAVFERGGCVGAGFSKAVTDLIQAKFKDKNL